ncbi:hypothetical protein ALI22I_11010 [Saccharothrix sp. ALI-22-I]|nr:hypothetical protein ALI22I_11010 [Saccharothrix sp. ALI-22-I]
MVEAPLTGTGEFRGDIALPSAGLWFVYTELRSEGRVAEAWVPVDFADRGVRSERRSLYLPAGAEPAATGQYLAGAALLLVGAALVAWAARVVRRASYYGD